MAATTETMETTVGRMTRIVRHLSKIQDNFSNLSLKDKELITTTLLPKFQSFIDSLQTEAKASSIPIQAAPTPTIVPYSKPIDFKLEESLAHSVHMFSPKRRRRMTPSITFITGCMFSGKTTEAMRRIRNAICADSSCIGIKANIDTRFDKKGQNTPTTPSVITTHSKLVLQPDVHKKIHVETIDQDCLLDYNLSPFDVIFVDEGHFFKNINKFALHWAKQNKRVIVSFVNGRFDLQPLGEINFGIATEIVHLNAVCKECGAEDGCYSYLLPTAKTSGGEFECGGEDMYCALCFTCYFSKGV